jgi:hypothetical protein
MMERPHGNCYWVVPGKLLAGEYPGAKGGGEAQAKIERHLATGITCFIDLTEPGELEAYEPLLGGRAMYRRFSIQDLNVPKDQGEMIEILDTIDQAVADDHTVYLHCWGGVGRTGTVVGCYLVRHGLQGSEALEQIAEWWRGVAKAYRIPGSPETLEQKTYVRAWLIGA